MADLTQTGTSVYPNVGTATSPTFAPKVIRLGEAVTGGMPLYQKTSTDNKWYKAIANGTAEQAGANGLVIAATAGSADQWIVGLQPGDIHIGAAGSVGTIYCISAANAGGIAPYGDLGSGNYVTQLGQVRVSGILSFQPVIGAPLA